MRRVRTVRIPAPHEEDQTAADRTLRVRDRSRPAAAGYLPVPNDVEARARPAKSFGWTARRILSGQRAGRRGNGQLVRDSSPGSFQARGDDSDLKHVHPPRKDSIGARSAPYGPARVEVYDGCGSATIIPSGRTPTPPRLPCRSRSRPSATWAWGSNGKTSTVEIRRS